MELSEEQAPTHNVIDSDFSIEASSITVMCYGVKFIIEVEARVLEGTNFEKEYQQLAGVLEDIDNDDDNEQYEAICDLMINPCFQMFRRLAPPFLPNEELTIQQFYYPETVFLRLSVSDQLLTARRSANRLREPLNSLTVPSAQLPNFGRSPRIKASDLMIISDGLDRGDLCEFPKQVRTDGGIECFFKPAFDVSQHVREIESLTSIAQAGLSGLRVSRLVGIVISDNGNDNLGIVIQWIPLLWDLRSPEARQDKSKHASWKIQVTRIVEELHKNDIIWGDVHPGNILIDENMDAWVIDFGGGYIEPFVPRKLRHTKEGDLHGIEKVFEYLNGEGA